MCAHWGRTVRTFFDVEMVEPRLGIDLPIEGETILHRNPQFLRAQILDADLMFNRTVCYRSPPLPGEAEMRRCGFVNERYILLVTSTCIGVELPVDRRVVAGDFDRFDE